MGDAAVANGLGTRLAGSAKEAWGDFSRGARAFPGSVRTAVRDPRSMVEGAAVTPIVVLFGHTFLDAFDRGGFNIILPDVQKAFDLDLAGITGLASVSIITGIVLSLPISLRSDRSGHRTLYLALGAFVAAFFSLTAGVAATIGLFGVSRAGFGFGLIVNDPVQQSLLSDYAPVRSRPSVFAGRQIADNLGGLMGPLVFGLLTWAIGWRAPLILVAVMAVVIAVLSLRLREPSKGGMERLAMGATGADLDAEDEPAGFREAYRILKVIPTVRTMWFSLPFLFGGVLGLLILIPLFLEEVYGLDAAERGLLTAFQGAFGIFGLFLGTALTKRYLFSDAPQRMFRLVAGIALAIAVGLCFIAAVDNLVLMIVGGTVLTMLFSLVLPGFGTLFSIIYPPNARTVGFAITRLWVLPGLIMLPIVGAIGDAHGFRWGMLASLPVFLVGAFIIGSGGQSFQADMAAAHEASMAAIRERNAAARDAEPADAEQP